MSISTQPKVTITAHQSHWYDILAAILKGIGAANPFLAVFIPAPIEAGIQLATTLEPVIVGAVMGQAQEQPTAQP